MFNNNVPEDKYWKTLEMMIRVSKGSSLWNFVDFSLYMLENMRKLYSILMDLSDVLRNAVE